MTSEDDKQQDGTKGFAGLSSMVSDVDATVASAKKQAHNASSDAKLQQSTQDAQSSDEDQPKEDSWAGGHSTAQPPSGSSIGKWLLWIGVIVIGVIWLVNQEDKKTPQKSTYSPKSSFISVPAPAPVKQPTLEKVQTPTSAPAKQQIVLQPKAPSRPIETKPSVGRNNVLSDPEIRYCLAEKIRLDTSEPLVNKYLDSDVDRFNKYVNDYNSRCGAFRYQQGALERARKNVELFRNQLQADGRSRFVSSAAAKKSQTSIPANKSAPDSTVKAIQRRLNDLGYNAGTADGLFGGKTRSAIQAFQRDNGIVVDGVANTLLLQRLVDSKQTKKEKESSDAVRQSHLSSSVRPSTAPLQDMLGTSAAEKAAVERACDSARRYSGPSAYKSCLSRELASLKSSGGRPDLSFATSSERSAIESACNSAKQYSGPGAYYNCLKREISSLRVSSGRPDLSVATASERDAIERACNSAKKYSGPGAYYNCLGRELSGLRSSGGKPDLSSASVQERSAIERACNSSRQYSGPGAYYGCLNREIASLRSSGGRPSLSSMSASMQAAVERACNSSRQYSGPGSYYKCLRRELSNAGYR